MDRNKIVEALQVQPLTEEEKSARHILGRLYGPIATYLESTRNERKYNKQLWETALADDIFQEKVKNKSLFLELGHPTDREETDMTKVCACIPEMPKIIDGDLCAYVDILDTPNGRLLKTLIDYGFVPGISSRGSGDIMENNEVDPETFFLETWDIVQLPAVKKARLNVCESIDTNTLKLRKALTESYDKLSDDEKKVVKEALDNLNIKFEQDADNIPWSEGEEPLLEEEAVEETEEQEVTETEAEEAKENTVQNFLDNMKDYDGDLELEFKPIIIGDKEYPVENLDFDTSEEGKLIVAVNYTQIEDSNKEEELPEDENPEVDIEVSSTEEENTETADESEEAIDAGADEVIESFKELIRQKDLLENEIKTLRNEKAVSDAEVNTLKEDLDKYKTGFMRVSELASKSKEFEKQVQGLQEQLVQKDTALNQLKVKIANTAKLNESMHNDTQQIKVLTEKLSTVQKEAVATEKALTEQVAAYKQKLVERTNTAKSYKNKFAEVLNRYVESKASMLGVKASYIMNKLGESYSIDDIDAVCDSILNEGINQMNRMPFGVERANKVQINESKVKTEKVNTENGYEIDDSLLELAGLK